MSVPETVTKEHLEEWFDNVDFTDLDQDDLDELNNQLDSARASIFEEFINEFPIK